MNKSFATTLTSTGQFSQHFVSLSSDVDKFGKNLDRGRLKLNDYYNAWSGHTKKTSNLIRDLAKQQVMLQQAIVQPVGKNAQGQMQYNVMVAKGLDEIKNKMAIARQEAAIMNKVMLDGSTGLINWGKNTQWAGRQLTVGLTVPLVMFGAAAQKAFREADAELVRLTKVYGGLAATSSADLAQVRKDVTATAREIAGSYGVAYKETIALAADLAATGQQGNDLIAATQQTTRLAVLGEVDRQDAMKATLAIQNAFKQSTDELAQSIDFLNAVENQTSTSLADLTEAIPKAGPVIKSLGGDVKDLALYLTAMKEGGVNASEGANAIKSAMASLINPTKVATEQFMGFGIDLKGIVNDNAGDLTATILSLQAALDNLNPLDKSRAIEQLFGKFQFARMSALFENLGKSGSQTLQVMDLMKASVTELAAISDRELKMMTESASGQFKRAWASVQADLAGAGEQFLRISTKVLKVVDAIIKFFQKLPEPVKTLLNVLGGFTAIAGPLIMLTGVMGNFIGYVIKGIFHLRQLAKGGHGFKLLTPEIIAADAAAKGLATSFYSDTEATIVLSNAVNTLAESFINLEAKANAAKVSVQPAVSTVAGGVIMAAGPAGRVVDKNNPLVGAPYSRDMSHLIPSGNPQAGTIFGTVPGSKPVNIRVGRNPQAYMDSDLPKIPGLTSIGGTSTGIVAAEAAKWHAMTAAIAMQSEAELKILKAEVMATGTVTSSLSDSYQALLPEFSQITDLAAKETAAIVQQVQQSKITVEQARARIISLNATVEAMLAETTRLTAAGMGRTANLGTVPLTSQPVVDPATGKSNMKEMFHKGPTKAMVDRIARALGGVRTSGAGYNIETTKPKFAKGGFVPGTGNTDTYHTTAEPGSFVINKAATEKHLPLITNILGGKSYYAQEGGQVPVVLTPGEAVIPAHIAQRNMPLMYELNGGPGNTSGLGRNGGGGLGNPKKLALQRTHITEDLSGMALLLPRELNLGVNSNGKGLTGSYIASLIRATLDSGMNPNSLMNEAAVTLGGDAVQAERRNSAALKELIRKLELPENASRMIGGKLDPFGFERLAKEIFKPALRGIRIDPSKAGGRRNLFSAISQVFTERAKEVLTKDEAIARGLITGKPNNSIQKGQIVKRKDGRLTWVSENRTIGSRLPSWAKGTNLATLLTTSSGVSHALKIIARRNAGGEIGENIGLNDGGQVPMAQRLFPGGTVFLGMPRSIKQVEAQRAAKTAMVKADQAVKDSRFSKKQVTEYGEILSPTTGRSFPVAGIGGIYSKDGSKVFVKPVLDEKAALAEMRATQIAREVHGLHAPKQKIVVIKDPTDPAGKRKLLALESEYDPRFASTDSKFTNDQYFRQLVASALRGDKDLGRGNLSGNVLGDVGPAGVFSTASGLRDYSAIMPSFKHQAMVNLLGVKGSSTKKFFAEATSDIPKGMTADQYNDRMLKEINEALPKLKQTVARFPDLTAEEKVIYNAMIERLSDARRKTYQDLHGVHSSVTMSPEKTMTPAAIAKMLAADELKRRQSGHAVSLSDNAFKTPQNGFILGGLIGAITKGKALHRIGAGFGKDSTGGWGVTSLEIGMAEKLFASTGLTKRTQRILYDKLAGELAKEMPYGYTKNAKGQLIKALEPDIMDTVIRSAASSTLSDPLGRKVLSQIDREILRKKFANWESKKDTSITDALKQLIFKLEGREKGGPVNAGQPYIVGEKGPELFVPRNAGGIIPNGYKAGGSIPNGFRLGGIVPMLKQLLLFFGIQQGANYAGDKVGGTQGDVIKQVGSILPFLAMGSMMNAGAGKGTSIMGNKFIQARTPIGAVGANKITGAPQLTKYGTMLSKLTGSSNLFSKALGISLSIFTRFNLAVGAGAAIAKYGYDRWQAHKEALRLNALGYGMTAEAAEKAGLKFTNFNDKIKEAINNAKALKERNTLLYESMQGSGTPLDITIEEYKKLKKEVKTNYSDQVALINQTGNEDPEKQRELAIRLKEQLIAMGMSAEDAAKKIYTMYALSDQSANAAAYTVRSQGFNDIKDTASAAASAIDSLTTAMATNRDATEQANQLNTAMMALSTDVESRQAKALKEARKKAAKDGTYFSSGQEKQLMLDQEKIAIDEINSQVENQVYLTKEVVDEMAKIDPSIRQIVNEQETALSLWQKTRIQVKGYTGDLRALNAEQTNDLYNLQISLGKKVESANREGVLKKQYADLDRMLQLQTKYQKAARGQSVADQISDRDKIASLQKQIDANNKLADARLKALDAAKQEGDIGREIAKKQAEYDAALATGNIAGAQQASLDIQGYQSELQYNAQKKSIEDSNILKNVPLQKLIEAIQSKQQGISDNAQLAGEKLGDLSGKITDTESAISEVNTAMLNWQIELLKKPEAERQAWRTGEQSKKMLAAVADAAEKAGVKLNGLKDLDLGAAMVASLEGKLGALSTIDVNGNVIINIDGKRLNIGPDSGSGTRSDPYNLGKAGTGTTTIPGASLESYGNARKDWGPMGISQRLEALAKERGVNPGEFFSVTDKDGKISTFKVRDNGSIERTGNPYNRADGGHIRGAGTATSDSIPAYLSNGEYVIKADSVSKYGVETFDALNAGKYAAGGPINPTPQSKHNSSFGTGGSNINVNMQGGKLMGPIEAWQDANKQIIKIEVPPITANFATNSYTLNKEQRLELQAIAKDLIKHKLASIVVQGHTDSVGKGKDNKILSQNRANAIAEYMSKFVPGTAFTPVGYGEYRPLVPNTTAENRARNRRAELFLPDKYKTIYPEFVPEKHETFLSKGKIEGGGSIGPNGTLVSGGSMESVIDWGKLFKKVKKAIGFHTGGEVGHRHGRNLPKTKSKYKTVDQYREEQGMNLGNTSSAGNSGGTNWLKFLEPGEVSDPSKRSDWSNLVHSFSNTMTPVMKHTNPGGPILYELFGKYLQQSATNIYAGEGKWNDYTSIGSTFAGGPIAKGVGLVLKSIPKALQAIKVGQKLKAGNFDDLMNIGKSTKGKSRPSIMQAADGSVHYMKIMQDVMEGAFEVTGSTIAKRFKMPSTDNILGSWKNLSVILSKDFASKGMKTLEDAGAMLPHGALDMDWLKANASMKSFGKMRAVSSILGHGDMHPGNLLLKGKKTLGAFDWGMIDSLTNPAETALKAGSTLVGKQASQFTKGFASVRKSIAKQGPEKFIDDILTKSGITDEGQLKVLRSVLERNVKSLLDLKIPGKFHKGGAVHPHRADGSHEVTMSAMTPQKQAATDKAMDKLYEKNPDYYKNKNGEWTKKGPSQWEKYTTASNWKGLFQNGGGTGAIYDDITSKILTLTFGPNASKMNSTGKDFKKGEWITGGLNLLTAGLTGTVSTAFGRAFIEQLGISKGIPGLGALLPKGSFPFLGAAGSKLATNAATAAVIGGARPFVESKLAPTIQKPKVKVTAEQFKPNNVYPPYVLHEGMSVPLHSGGPFGNDAVVFQGIDENLSSLLTNHQVSAVIPTTPEGILSYVLKKDPSNKKAQDLLDKINSGYQWGDRDVKEFLMNMLAAGNVNLKNVDPYAITNSSSSEGLIQLISAMKGNAKDSIAIKSKTKAMAPILSRMAEEYAEKARLAKIAADARTEYNGGLRGGFFGNRGEEPLTRAEIAAYRARGMEPHYIPTTPDDIPMIRVFNDEFPRTDGQGDLFETAAGFKIFDRFVGPKGSVAGTDDAASHSIARTSRHFGIYDAVQSHMQGAWKPDKPFIVSTLSNLMKYNGKPEQLHSADSYFLQGFGKPFHYSKKEGQLSSVFPLEESAYISKLKELGLHKDGEPLPVITENPSTKEIFYLSKEKYSQRELDEILKEVNENKNLRPIEQFDAAKKSDPDHVRMYGDQDFYAPARNPYEGDAGQSAQRALQILAIDKAKKQIGIDQPYSYAVGGEHQSLNQETIMELAAKLGVRFDGGHNSSDIDMLARSSGSNPFTSILNTYRTSIGEIGPGISTTQKALDALLMWTRFGKYQSGKIYPNENDLKAMRDSIIGQYANGAISNKEFMEKIAQISDLMDDDMVRGATGGYLKGGKFNIPKFETGINSVPVDMLAMLHKNEAVVPANMNPFNPNANNATMGGATYNITNNINGFDGDINQLSNIVTQKTITAIKTLDSRNSKMSGTSMTVGVK
jgi:TP901 family phage tail tape measure protein